MRTNSDEILQDRNETQQDPLERQDEIDQLIEKWREKYALTPDREEEGEEEKPQETRRHPEEEEAQNKRSRRQEPTIRKQRTSEEEPEKTGTEPYSQPKSRQEKRTKKEKRPDATINAE